MKLCSKKFLKILTEKYLTDQATLKYVSVRIFTAFQSILFGSFNFYQIQIQQDARTKKILEVIRKDAKMMSGSKIKYFDATVTETIPAQAPKVSICHLCLQLLSSHHTIDSYLYIITLHIHTMFPCTFEAGLKPRSTQIVPQKRELS